MARERSTDGPGKVTAFGLARTHRLGALQGTDGGLVGDREGWLVELAWDGHRVLACRSGADVKLYSADLRDWRDHFSRITLALRRLEARDVVVEGWLCALDDAAKPSFERLREHVGKKNGRVVFALWDLLHLDGEDLRGLPLRERRRQLAALLGAATDPLFLSAPLDGDLARILGGTRALGMRGVVARALDAPHPTVGSAPWFVYPCGEEALSFDRSLSAAPTVTNKDKVLFPRDGIAKEAIVRYYADVAPLLLPLMRDRPVVCQRWPDGIDEFTWYQHRMPPRAPDYLRAVWIEGNRRIVIESAEALGWFVNQAALTFHGWASRVGSLAAPDWATIDLDPGESTTWAQTIEVAHAVRHLLELLELPSVVKTSGQRGLHVLVPLAPGQTVRDTNEFARRAALVVSRLLPELVTLETEREKRKGRLYLDWLQNFAGKTLVLPYSLRAADGATVSTLPLAWSEVSSALDPRAFNLRTLRGRLDTKGDLAAPLLAGKVRLDTVLPKMNV